MRNRFTVPALAAPVFAIATLLASPLLRAAPEPEDASRQTPWQLYLTSSEAFDLKLERGADLLFVDVRDPVEIMFTGFTDVVDVNIPYMLANRERWNDGKSVFQMERNPDFEPAIARALEARGLPRSTPIVLMCRSGGTRGAPSAKALEGKGYEAVYVVVDGFEGGTVKEGTQKNWRLKDGWKNAGLPWSYKLDRKKMYLGR